MYMNIIERLLKGILSRPIIYMEEIIKWHKGDDPIDDGDYLAQYKYRNIEYFESACFINGRWMGSEAKYIIAWANRPKGIIMR